MLAGIDEVSDSSMICGTSIRGSSEAKRGRFVIEKGSGPHTEKLHEVAKMAGDPPVKLGRRIFNK